MKLLITVLISFAVPSISSAQTNSPAKEATCRTCHGVGGAAPIAPVYPKLNGQNKEYIVSSLKAYRDGQRTGGLAGLMLAQSSMLSDAEMEELAEYYSSQK